MNLERRIKMGWVECPRCKARPHNTCCPSDGNFHYLSDRNLDRISDFGESRYTLDGDSFSEESQYGWICYECKAIMIEGIGWFIPFEAEKQLTAKKEPARAIGFNSEGMVPAGDVVTITTRPFVNFRGTRFYIPNIVAKDFEIVDICVGKNSQFSASEPLPGPSFSQVRPDGIEGRLFDLDLAQEGSDITIRVRNIRTYPSKFISSLHGFDCE